MIRRRIREGQLFTFLDEGLASVGPVPPTNNLIRIMERAPARYCPAATVDCGWSDG